MIKLGQSLIFILLLSPLLTSCFKSLDASGLSATGTTSQYITTTDFPGIVYAQNTNHGVSVTWPIVANGKSVSAYHVYRYVTLSSPPKLVGNVDPNANNYISYVDGSAVSGSKYTYMVKAVDPNGNEDSNTATKSVFAWSGLTGYTTTGNNSITVNFGGLTQSIYLKLSIRRVDPTDPTNNSALQPNLITVLSPGSAAMTNGNYTFTSYCNVVNSDGVTCASTINLSPGAQYQLFGEIFENNGDWGPGPQSYCNTLSYPDCSPFAITFTTSPFTFTYSPTQGMLAQTLSYGFDIGGDATNPGWQNVSLVRAFGNSPGTQTSVNDATGLFVPHGYQVDMTFKAFNMPSGYIDYEYVVTRTLATTPIDTSTLNPSWSTSLQATSPWIPEPYYQQVSSTTGSLGLCPSVSSPTFSTTYMNPCVVIGCDNIPRTKNLNATYWNSSTSTWTPSAKLLSSDATISCTDLNAWTSGVSTNLPKYRYTLAIRHFDNSSATKIPYNEHFTAANINEFSITVAIPPNDMVLLNRESVNFEMCENQLSLAPDPLNHNRCANKVAGMTTLNSGPGKSDLNLSSGYYDFGYNLFVDRYPLACKWTKNNAVPTTKDLTNYYQTETTGIAGTDAGATGVSADVLFQQQYQFSAAPLPGTYSNCYVNVNGTFQPMNAVLSSAGTYASNYFAKALTNAPCDSNASGTCMAGTSQSQRPTFSYPYWDSTSANAACGSFSDPVYGAKRIPRMREFRAFNAMPVNIQVGSSYVADPYYSLMNNAYTPTGGTNTWNTGACITNLNASTVATTMAANSYLVPSGANANDGGVAGLTNQFAATNIISTPGSLGANFFTYLDGAIKNTTGVPGFFSGSAGTSDCVSRYGVANVLDLASAASVFNNPAVFSNNTAWYPLSDAGYYVYTNATTVSYTGENSNIDSGNTDLSVDYTTYYSTGYVMNPPGSGSYLNNAANATEKFDYALGLPMTWTASAYAQNYLTSPTTANNFNLYSDSGGDTLLSYFPTTTGIYDSAGNARWGTGFMPSTGSATTTTSATTSKNSLDTYSRVYSSRVRCVLSAE